MPTAGVVGNSVPNDLPSACRDPAQDHAEVTMEDRVPANVLFNSELCAVPDLETADKASTRSVGEEMAKQVDAHVLAVPDFNHSYGCKSPRS